MRIVLATHSLEGIAGSETYVVTAADHLQRLGHEVWLYTEATGRGSDLAKELGIRVAATPRQVPADCDVALAQDGVVACRLAEFYPTTPQVFVTHSDIFDLQLPPQLPGLVAAVVALYDRAERRIRALSLEPEVVRLSQPVDVERFKPTRALPPRARVVLLYGNYVHGERMEMVGRACEAAGLELRHVGQHGDGIETRPELRINEADIVIGKARVIIEAMASGRAAYVFDHNGGDGWVTADGYERLAADNFGGQGDPIVIDEERLAADLAEYDPQMGLVNRDLAVAHHSATKHAAALVDVLRSLAPRRQPVDAPLDELARTVRVLHRADAHAFALHVHAEQLTATIRGLETQAEAASAAAEQARGQLEATALELAQLREQLDATRSDAEASRRDAEISRAESAQLQTELERARADNARAQQRFAALAGTRRWRAVQALMRPLDLVRRRA